MPRLIVRPRSEESAVNAAITRELAWLDAASPREREAFLQPTERGEFAVILVSQSDKLCDVVKLFRLILAGWWQLRIHGKRERVA